MTLRCIDLFAGCGGTSTGATLAGLDVVAALYGVEPVTSHSTVTPSARARRTAVSASIADCRPLSMSDTVACETRASGTLAASASSRIDSPFASRACFMRSPKGVGEASFAGFRAGIGRAAMVSMRGAYVNGGVWLQGQPFVVVVATGLVRLATAMNIDITGGIFGRLTVTGRAESKNQERRWVARCSCGAEVIVSTHALRGGNTKSCGCLKLDLARARIRELGKSALTHGLSYGPEYRVWQTMRLRCHVPTNPAFKDYGARGITVCARWLNDVRAFVGDVGPKPTARHEIDRKDNDGGYWCGKSECPDCGPAGRACNVRWATRSQNCRNRRSNKMVTYRGETKPLTEWIEALGLAPHAAAIQARFRDGWGVDDAFERPLRRVTPWGGKSTRRAA
jgi:hypothetical protein